MQDKEVEEIRWSNYSYKDPQAGEEILEDSLSILKYLDSKKADVVNWEERAEMDRITKARGGQLLSEGQPSESKFSENEKENELMSGLADIMKRMEENNGK